MTSSQGSATPPPPAAKSFNPQAALERLSLVLQLERRSRSAEREELPFVMVNETRQLLTYRQAVLFSVRRTGVTLAAVSGLAVPDASSPFSQWMAKFAKWRLGLPGGNGYQRLDLGVIAAESTNPPKWLPDWTEWLPRHGLWAPLPDGRGGLSGVLALFREEPFSEPETALFSHLSESYGQTFALRMAGKGRRARHVTLGTWIALFLVLAGVMCIPVRQTELAPAEVTARRPALVRSGLDGVVDKLLVEPNQEVEKGDILVRLEDAQLRTKLALAKKAEEMAAVEYRQLLQSALSDPKTKQRLPLVQGRMEQLAAETAYIDSQMERVVIASPMKGVVLCDNPDEWLGRPVSLGQRIMLVADPGNLELEIRLPITASLEMMVGERVLFYPNVTPIDPMPAVITFVGYRATEVPGVGMAYVLKADISTGGKPFLGLRGSAKMYGESQPVGLILFRTPIMAVRQWLGI